MRNVEPVGDNTRPGQEFTPFKKTVNSRSSKAHYLLKLNNNSQCWRNKRIIIFYTRWNGIAAISFNR